MSFLLQNQNRASTPAGSNGGRSSIFIRSTGVAPATAAAAPPSLFGGFGVATASLRANSAVQITTAASNTSPSCPSPSTRCAPAQPLTTVLNDDRFAEQDDDVGLPDTVVFVDGSYVEPTANVSEKMDTDAEADSTMQIDTTGTEDASGTAGCGVYFPGDGAGERSIHMAFTLAPINSVRAELAAALLAARIFFEEPLPPSQRHTSHRRLVIKQDCLKATQMVLLCTREIKNAQYAQRKRHEEIITQRRQLVELEEALRVKTTEHEAKFDADKEKRRLRAFEQPGGALLPDEAREEEEEHRLLLQQLNLDRDVVSIREHRTRIQGLLSRLPDGPIPSGISPPSLASLFLHRPREEVLLDVEKFQVTVGDIIDSLDLIDPFLTLYKLCPIYFKHVYAHQKCPPEHQRQAHLDWRGNNFADMLAKKGRRSTVTFSL